MCIVMCSKPCILIPSLCCELAFPVSKLEGKRNAIVGLLESGCTEPSGKHVLLPSGAS